MRTSSLTDPLPFVFLVSPGTRPSGVYKQFVSLEVMNPPQSRRSLVSVKFLCVLGSSIQGMSQQVFFALLRVPYPPRDITQTHGVLRIVEHLDARCDPSKISPLRYQGNYPRRQYPRQFDQNNVNNFRRHTTSPITVSKSGFRTFVIEFSSHRFALLDLRRW